MDKSTGALSLNGEWSLGEEAYLAIIARLRRLAPKTIVEFGSGVSTVRLAMDLDRAEIYAIEHDKGFFQETLDLKARYGVTNVHVLHCPLAYSVINFRVFQTYRINPRDLPETIDAALIDGPPYYTLFGREACLHQIHDRLNVGGVVILDDYHRSHEQLAVKNWLCNYPDAYMATTLGVGHGLCVLEKTRSAPPRLSLPQLISNYRSAGAHLLRRIPR